MCQHNSQKKNRKEVAPLSYDTACGESLKGKREYEGKYGGKKDSFD